MDIDKILSIGGKPGLYELKAQTRGGFVAQSLQDGKKISVSIRHQVSLLSEIAVYTLSEELPLRQVFQKIKEKEDGNKTPISHKASKIELEEYFFAVVPEYDEDRVYASDIKKIVQWYNLLIDYGITNFVSEEDTQDTSEESEA